MEPAPSAMKVWSLTHWTAREFPDPETFYRSEFAGAYILLLLNCLFLNSISYTVRVENLFFSLPSPLMRKHFFSIGLISVAVIIITAVSDIVQNSLG